MKTKSLKFILIDDDHDEHYLFEQDVRRLAPTIALQCFDSWHNFEAYVKSEPPDCLNRSVVLLDLNMPEVSGHEVIQRMRADKRLKSLPIVIYSTSKSQADIRRSYELGANSFISKPADRAEAGHLTSRLVNYWANCVELPASQ